MMDYSKIAALQFELAMAIGSSLDLELMLRSVGRVLLRALDATGLAVYRAAEHGRLLQVFKLPRVSQLPEVLDGELAVATVGRPLAEPHSPSRDASREVRRERLPIPGFGALLLERTGPRLDERLLRALEPLLVRLAHASKACLLHAELERSHARYDALIRTIPDVLFEGHLEPDGRLTFSFISQAALVVLGLEGDDVHALPSFVLEREVKDGSGSLADAIARSSVLGEALDVVLRPGAGDTKKRWLRFSAVRHQDLDPGRGWRWSGTIQDVTEHERLAETELQQTRGRLSALLSAAADAIVVADIEGRVTDWNHGAEALFGYRHDEIVGEPLTRIIPARMRAAHLDGMARHRLTGESRVIGRPVELSGLHAQGHEVPVELVLNCIQREEGTLYVAVLRDLSERYRADALRRSELAHERRLASVLVELTRLPSGDLMLFKTRAMALVATTLGLDRVTIWRQPTDGRWREVVFDAGTGQSASLERTSARSLDLYLASVDETTLITTSEPSTDPTVATVVYEHLEPAGVASLVVVPLILLDTHHGVLLLERIDARDWSVAETRFCEDVGRLISQVIDNANNRHFEALNAAVLASIREGVVACDDEGRVTLVNPVAERLTGWSTHEARGLALEAVLALDTWPPNGMGRGGAATAVWDPAMLELVGAGRGLLRRRDTTPVPIAFAASSIDTQSTRLGTVITFRDVTEEEASSRALESRNEQLRSISEALPDLLFTVGIDGHLQYRGGGHDAGLITEAADLTDRFVGDVFAPRVAAEILEAVRKAIRSGAVQTVEYAVAVGRGALQDFEVRIARLTDDSTTALVRDVTHERESARALRLERERLNSVLSTTSAIIYSARLPDYQLDFVSESAESVLGFTTEQLREPGFWAASLHPLDRDRVLEGLVGLESRGSHIHEYRHRHRDGSYRWLRDELRVITGATGEPLGAVGASFDITDRKLNEQRLESLLVIQEIVATASSAFLASNLDSDSPLDLALARLGEHFQSDRTYVFSVQPDGLISNTHEWCGPGIEPFKDQLQDLATEDFAFFIDPIRHGAPLIIQSVRALPDSAATTREILGLQGIERLVAVPLLHNDVLLGFLGVDNPQIEPVELTELAPLLRLLADTLAAGHQRRIAELSLIEANANLAANNRRQRALVELSTELAQTTGREDTYELLGPRILSVLDFAQVSVFEYDSASRVLRFVLLSAIPEQVRHGYIEQLQRMAAVPIDAMAGTAIIKAIVGAKPISSLEHPIEQMADWRHLQDIFGQEAFLVVPIVTSEGILGTLNLASLRADALDEDVIAWCTQLSLLVGAHLGAQRARSELERVNASLERTVLERTEELRASEARFALLFEKAPQAMLLVDRGHEVVQANASARSMFRSGASFPRLPIELLLPAAGWPDHDLTSSEPVVGAGRAQPTGSEKLTRARRLDHTHFDAEISLQPIELGGITHIVAGVADVTDRLASEQAIVASLREKETLLKEVHHRVKNNLQMISGLLALQSAKVSSEETRRLLDESVGRVRSMALIHQQIYGVDSLDRVDFGNYVRALCESIRSMVAPDKRIKVEVESVMLTVQVALPLGLILNELMTNAFKYGVRGDDEASVQVLVTLSETNGQVTLEVHDSGPGLPEDFDPARTQSLGMRLVKMLVSQLRGVLHWSSVGGASFSVVFDLDSEAPPTAR